MNAVATAPGRTLQIETPRVFLPFLQPSRYKGAHGGRGSGKSHAFADLLVERALLTPGLRAVCIREVQMSLAESVKRLLEDKIRQHGLEGDGPHAFRLLQTHIETPGGGIILFRGMQSYNADNIKSLEGYDLAWVEEAQALSQRSLDLLRPTIRKPGSEIWFSWNPRFETDPVDVFLRGPGAPGPPEAIVIEANYADNPWFPEELRREMERDRARDPEKYAHVWCGGYERRSESRVFRRWRIEDFSTPTSGVAFLLGGDWGFAQDPTVLVRAFLRGDRELCIDAEAYQVGCEIDDTPALFDRLGCAACLPAPCACHPSQGGPVCDGRGAGHGMARQWPIVADSADPQTISYLKRHGYPRIEPARKGPGSVQEGVKFLQNYDLVVHPRCVHTIRELGRYAYKVDKQTGLVLPELEDEDNHVIDSLRYACERLRRPTGPPAAAAHVEALL